MELWRQVVTRMAVRLDEILWLKSIVFVRQGRQLLKVSQLGDSYSLNMTTVSRLDIHSAHSQSVNDKGIILNWPKSCQLVQHPNISIFVCHEDCCRTYTTTELTSFCFISYQNSAGEFTMNHSSTTPVRGSCVLNASTNHAVCEANRTIHNNHL